MDKRRISIVFCGGCNPKIDRDQVAVQVRDALVVKGYEVLYNSLDVDLAIYLSGCMANCALKYKTSNLPVVVVSATTVDAISIDEVELVTEIVTKVGNCFGKLEKCLSK